MNKTQLASVIAEKSDISNKKAMEVIEALTGTISNALSEGESVQILSFGTFKVNDRAARKGRNPQTGQEIDIPAAKVPVWKASKGLID